MVRENNNFDLMRLFASVTVIFGHSFYLFDTGGYSEPVTLIIRKNFSGTLAVGVFFFLSGILISHSFIRSRVFYRFVLMRIARIYPGTLVCLFIVAFILGPIATSNSLLDYFSNPQVYCYIRSSWSFTHLFPEWATCSSLPGVFAENRLKYAPNGSLWTLYPEVVCYAFVFVLGMAGFLKSRWRIIATIISILVLHTLNPKLIPYFSDDHYTDFLKVGLFFLAGVSAYALRDVLTLRFSYAAILSICAIFLQKTVIEEYALYIALFYIVLLLSSSPKIRKIKLSGDYSFGVYIYGWPIQQTIYHFFPNITSYPSNLICIPMALIAGYFSWNLIERPVLMAASSISTVDLPLKNS